MARNGNRRLKKGGKPKPAEARARGGRVDVETVRHLSGIALGGAALLVGLALVSVTRTAGDLVGPFGEQIGAGLLARLGLLAFLVPALLAAAALPLVAGVRWRLPAVAKALWITGATVCAALLATLLGPAARVLGAPIGGRLAQGVAGALSAGLAVPGAALVVTSLGWALASLATGHATSRAAGALLLVAGRVLRAAGRWAAGAAATAWNEQLDAWARRDGDEETANEPLDPAALDEAVEEEARRRSDVLQASGAGEPAWARDSDVTIEGGAGAPPEPTIAAPPEVLLVGEDGRVRDQTQRPLAEPIALARADDGPPPPPPEAFLSGGPAPKADEEPPAPAIVESVAKPARRHKKGSAFELTRTGDGFTLPSLDVLELPPEVRDDVDRDGLKETAQKLTIKLADFGIKGHVETIRPGPVITMYEFLPAPGIRVSKIQALADDLAMAMEALQVRIVAPIPGKNVVGIEVPNKARQKVFLREILEGDAFQKMTSPLTLAFGKDTEGMPYVGDLSRMPHLLVAGTTGSGKSVSMNSMIMSLLFKASPEDVRLIMIDPKMVELSTYEGIPHLLLPVVQDAQKAPLALRWAVEEMERRYHLIGKLKVKDLRAYNDKVARMKCGEAVEEPAPEPPSRVVVVDVGNGETEEEALARLEEQAAPPSAPELPGEGAAPMAEEFEKLPYIVIIIDELADLMMVASRDVEQCIARLAAKARAAGIHLVIATQRPSTDVISGVIKSNLPVRIAFRLASRHDSATIINGPGAERLLGDGDMLHIPPGGSDPLRLHGALVREGEIERVVSFWKAQGQPVYDEEILRPREDEGGGGGADEVPDELYDQAVAVVSQLEKISISLLQRKMGVGYNRAADLIERMEREGVIGPQNGVKPREVLIRGLGEMTA